MVIRCIIIYFITSRRLYIVFENVGEWETHLQKLHSSKLACMGDLMDGFRMSYDSLHSDTVWLMK